MAEAPFDRTWRLNGSTVTDSMHPFQNELYWRDYLANLYMQSFEIDCPFFDRHTNMFIKWELMQMSRIAIIKPRVIMGSLIYRPERVEAHRFNVVNQDPITHEVTRIAIVVHNRPELVTWYNKEDFVIISTNSHYQTQLMPWRSIIEDFAHNIHNATKSLMQNHMILQQPIVMTPKNRKGLNNSSFFQRALINLSTVFSVSRDHIPDDGKLFQDIDRPNNVGDLLSLQRDLVDEFGRMLGIAVGDHDGGTYQAVAVQAENLEFNDFKRHTLIKILGDGVKEANDKFGCGMILKARY